MIDWQIKKPGVFIVFELSSWISHLTISLSADSSVRFVQFGCRRPFLSKQLQRCQHFNTDVFQNVCICKCVYNRNQGLQNGFLCGISGTVMMCRRCRWKSCMGVAAIEFYCQQILAKYVFPVEWAIPLHHNPCQVLRMRSIVNSEWWVVQT